MKNILSIPKEILQGFLLFSQGKEDPKALKVTHLMEFLDLVLDVVSAEPTVIEWEPKETIVVGDTHCDVHSSNTILDSYPATRLVFLGDYTGRTIDPFDDIRNVLLLFLEKLLSKDRIVLLRGNHEDEQICGTNGFLLSLQELFGPKEAKTLWKKFVQVFHQLPLAVSMKDIIILHGGLPKGAGLEEIRAIQRGNSFCDNSIMTQILWNDISVKDVLVESDRCSGAYTYGKTALEEYLRMVDKKVLIHGHYYSGKGVGCDGQSICLYTCEAYFYLPRGTPGDEADAQIPVPGNVIAHYDGGKKIEIRTLSAFCLGEIPFVSVEIPSEGRPKVIPQESFQTSIFRFLFEKFKQKKGK